MTLGWSTSGQRPLSVLPMIPLGTQVSSSSLLLQMPSTTRELERQATEMAVLCQDCVLQGTSWLAGSIPSLHTGWAGNDTSAPSFSTCLLRAQRQCSLICRNLLPTDLESEDKHWTTPRGTGKADL